MGNSNTARSTKKDGGKQASFTQLGGKNLRCNLCGEKVSRSQTEAHENSHSKPKSKFNKNIENINSEVRGLVETVLNAKNRLQSRWLLHIELNKNGTLNRFYELIKTIDRLPEQEKTKVNHKSIREIKKELGN